MRGTPLSMCSLRKRLQSAPSSAREVVAEHVEPAADHLPVDAVLGAATRGAFGVAHAGRHRPLRLVAGEGEAHGARLHGHLDGRERQPLRLQRVEQGGRHEMRMSVDDHGGVDRRSAAAEQFPEQGSWQ